MASADGSTPPLLVLGVEGGGSNTHFALLDGRTGRVLAERAVAEGSNGYLVGVPAVAALVAREAAALLARAGQPADARLAAFGFCGSGFLEKGPQAELITLLSAAAPGLLPAAAAASYVDNDSPGSIFTAAGARGGCVIIAGTGCMSQLITAEGRVVSCNGHGHLFGDEGSAWFISQLAVRCIFRELDDYAERGGDEDPLRRLDTTAARAAMAAHFGVDVAAGRGYAETLYAAMYGAGFNKGRVAAFAKALADVARSGGPTGDGDVFSRWLFAEAGRHLGSLARTLAPHLLPPGGGGSGEVRDFTVVCVGSVWKSWDLLRAGFVTAATAPFHHVPGVSREALAALPSQLRGRVASFKLVRLTTSSALGAGWQAARRAGLDMPLDCAANVEVLYSFPE